MKRTFDLLVSVTGLVALSPLLAIIALLVLVEDGRPVLFRQVRVGRSGAPFTILKFRTMSQKTDGGGLQLTVRADSRVTQLGRHLRPTKLDELPQLWNVVRGDMSLVGPRPEVPRFVAFYSEDQRRVLAVRPGITDPASLAFRNESERLELAGDPERTYVDAIMPEKLRINTEYLDRANLRSDVGVLLDTVLTVFRPSPSTHDPVAVPLDDRGSRCE